MSYSLPKISLSFSKTIEKKKLKVSALGNDHSQIVQENKHSILLFDKNIKPAESNRPEDSLIIPLVESKRETLYKTLKEKSTSFKVENENKKDEAEMTLDEKAAAAVIEESAHKLEELQNGLKNVPSLNETIALTASEGAVSSLEDYDQVNVEHYGAALLRGMGWSKDQGVGKNKKVIEIIDPTKAGLALTSKEGKKDKAEESEEEEEEVKKGCYVLIKSGRNRGTYGIIESVDEDHVLIRTAREDKVLRDVEQNIKVVSVKEYKEFSRVINKDMYDEYKTAEMKKRKEKKEDTNKSLKVCKKIKKEDKKKEVECVKNKDMNLQRDFTQSKQIKNVSVDKDKQSKEITENSEMIAKNKKNFEVNDGEREQHKRKNKHREDKSYKYKKVDREKSNKGHNYEKEIRYESIKNHLPTIPWARENLRVRIIDKEYKGGKYHKEKVIINSIDSVESCTCILHDGRNLYDVNPNHLETVIPKTSSALVLIVKGNCKGQKARILELQKEKEKATIQLLEDRSIILNLYYDDICEYVSR